MQHGLDMHQGKDALLVPVDIDQGEGGKANGPKSVRRVAGRVLRYQGEAEQNSSALPLPIDACEVINPPWNQA